MSRFDDDGGDCMDEDQEREFRASIDAAYVQARTDLTGFLAHLDAMPVKRIIHSRFVDPKTLDACSVAEYCRYKGETKLALLKTEGRSYYERLEGGDYERDDETGLPTGSEESGGWEGATVMAGLHAGLPHLVAYNLAFKNDESWLHVHEPDPTPCDARCDFVPNRNGHMRVREHRYGSCHSGHLIHRELTPEERWYKLRDHVARAVALDGTSS